MEKAKQVAKEFLSGDGKHKTTVDQDSRAAVTEEHVRPQRHENVTTAVDKDIHQEHHQTRIQPVKATETLAEKHTQNVVPVEHKTVHHGNDRDTRNTLQQDAAKFKNTSTTHDTTQTTSTKPTIGGERIHHHVHEHIQPVIEKETIAPEVVHTTVPIHETHHAAPVHHETTVLPAKHIGEFASGTGQNALGSKGTHTLREYEGCPKPYKESADAQRLIHGGENLASTGHGENLATTGRGENLTGNTHEGHGVRNAAAVGAVGAGGAATYGASKNNRGKLGRSGSSSSSSSDDESGLRKNRKAKAAGVTGGTTTAGSIPTAGLGNSSTGTSQQRKSSLKDKLNPRVDADGDGKAGIFD